MYGGAFSSRVQTMGIHEVKTAPRSPWQNPYEERLIGTLRRECLDHVVVLNETHLHRLLREYLIYYHGARTHLSLAKDAPESRRVERLDEGQIVETPMAGGLHHRYSRRAAYAPVCGPFRLHRRRRSVRAPRCTGTRSSVTRREAKEVHAACPSYQRPMTTGRSRSQGTWID